MADLQVIVLAAGMSKRMPTANKLLLPVEGVPLVRRTVSQLAMLKNAAVTVVLGHEAELVGKALSGVKVQLTVNERFAEGQMTSVNRGLAAAGEGADYMIVPADMPRLTTADCEQLLGACDRAKGACYSPFRNKEMSRQRGNPIVLPARQWPQYWPAVSTLDAAGSLINSRSICFR